MSITLSSTGKWALIGQSGAPASATGSTTETVLATVTIPANTIGRNGVLRVSGLFSFSGSAGTRAGRVRLGSTTIFNNSQASTSVAIEFLRTIRAANATSVQSMMNVSATVSGVSTSAAITTNVDTTQDQTLTISATLGDASDTATLLGYTIEALNP